MGHLEELLPLAWRCLKPGGEIFLWLSRQQASEVGQIYGGIKEVGRISLPSGGQGEIWWGKKTF